MNHLVYRGSFFAVIILSGFVVYFGFATSATVGTNAGDLGGSYYELYLTNNTTAPPRAHATVITAQSAPTETTKAIYVFGPEGRLNYYNTSRGYNDVDPVANTSSTVVYVASMSVPESECEIAPHYPDRGYEECTKQVLERLNISTGEVTQLYTTFTPGESSSNFHDVDHYGGTKYAVADIYSDRVFIVDVSSDTITWMWNASSAYSHDEGGPYPKDWTHLNDVEVLEEGRLMVSLRNQDQIVFLKPSSDDVLQESWTLGEEDNYSILYEQHNPDYIPESRGGPAVVVADSQNNRVVEYQRNNGSWKQTWEWTGPGLKWPRDADRLPNGHTVIVDSNGNRVLEVNREGKVIWSIKIPYGYDAERLSTGDESRSGPSATRANLFSVKSNTTTISSLTPMLAKWMNAIRFITPSWFGVLQWVGATIGGMTVLIWLSSEIFWLFGWDPRQKLYN